MAERIVEVIAESGRSDAPTFLYGSGCRVADQVVITAAHLVVGAHKVTVRGPDKVKYRIELDRILLGDPSGPGPDRAPDLALLTVIGGPAVPPLPLAVVDRTSVDAEPLERCRAVGYPEFADRDLTHSRDTVEARGEISVLSNLVSGLLTLQVRSSPRQLPAGEQPLGSSPWAGMSGAPVIADGYLVGVVTEHAPRAGPSAITVTPLSALERDLDNPRWGPGVDNPAQWWARLGLAGQDATVLPRLPRHPERNPAPYLATIREIRAQTKQFLGRETELAAITDFATGPPGYQLLVGDAWAGKTSLLAEAVAASIPKQVDVVAYFLSRRSVDADANRFLVAVVPQLARLLDEEPPKHLDADQFRALWDRCGKAAATAGRDLLLVVDGIDEDLRPPGTPSVAALLPVIVEGRAHVLVSSRPHPDVPADLPSGHPLSAVQPVPLKPFPGASTLKTLAVQEIDALKRGDQSDLAIDIFGILTAAAGPLAVEDVATLTALPSQATPAHINRVRRLVTEAAGRSLQRIGPVATARYQFAHSSLLEWAQADRDLTHSNYRARIESWALTWEEAGWPIAATSFRDVTPLYLVAEYLNTLTSDRTRQLAVAGDIRWSIASIHAFGVDRAIAQLQSAIAIADKNSLPVLVHAMVNAQAHHLRRAVNGRDLGFATRQLLLHALELAEYSQAQTLYDQLLTLPHPGLIPLWTTRRTSRALVLELGSTGERVSAIAVLPDGRVVTCGASDMTSGGRMLVWDPTQPDANPVDLGPSGDRVNAVAVLPDGRVVTGGDDGRRGGGRVLVWDPAQPGADPVTLGRTENSVNATAVLPDGRIVTGGASRKWGGGRLFVWDLSRPYAPTDVGRTEEPVNAVAVLPDGRIVMAITSGYRSAGRLLVWDPTRPDVEPIVLGHRKIPINAIVVLPDGRVLTGGAGTMGGGQVVVWDPARPDLNPVVLGHREMPVNAVAVLLDGRVVTAAEFGGGGRVLIWDPIQPSADPIDLGYTENPMEAVAVLRDGRVVTGGNYRGRGRVLVWDPTQLDPDRVDDRGEEQVNAVAMLPDGRVVTSGGERYRSGGQLLVWDPARPRAAALALRHTEARVTAIAALPDGRVATVSDDRYHDDERQQLLVWDPARPRAAALALRHTEARGVTAVAALPDGRVVTVSNNSYWGYGELLVWDPARPRAAPLALGRTQAAVTAMLSLPNGRVVAASADSNWGGGELSVWDPARPRAARLASGHTEARVTAVAALPDGRVVFGSADSYWGGGQLSVWDPDQPGVNAVTLSDFREPVTGIVALPGGQIAVSMAGSFRLLNPSTGQTVAEVACDIIALACNGTELVALHADDGLSGWSTSRLRAGASSEVRRRADRKATARRIGSWIGNKLRRQT